MKLTVKKIIPLLVIFLFSCGTKQDNPPGETKDDKPKKDNTYELKPYQAIVPAVENMNWAFGKNYKPWKPGPNDIETGERLLKECFDKESSGTANPFSGRKLEDYNRQFIGAVIEGGNRVILVNCFCRSEEKTLKEWKEKMVLVADGGNCFFYLKVNIDTGRYYGLMVNGNA
jgi:hypothetical protein